MEIILLKSCVSCVWCASEQCLANKCNCWAVTKQLRVFLYDRSLVVAHMNTSTVILQTSNQRRENQAPLTVWMSSFTKSRTLGEPETCVRSERLLDQVGIPPHTVSNWIVSRTWFTVESQKSWRSASQPKQAGVLPRQVCAVFERFQQVLESSHVIINSTVVTRWEHGYIEISESVGMAGGSS